MPLQLSKCGRLEIEPSVVGCGTVKRHKCRAPLTHHRAEVSEKRSAFWVGLGQSDPEQGFFAGRVHGRRTSVFSFACAAAISSQDGARQRRAVPSPLELARSVPSREKASPSTGPVCPRNVAVC